MNVEKLEELRKKTRNTILLGILISGGLAFLLREMSFFIFVIGIVVTIILSISSNRKFVLAFKDFFVLKSLQSIFSNLIYQPENGLPSSLIRNTEMMDMGDRYTSNDYVSGKYKNINVEQADVHIEEKHTYTDSKGRTRTTWVTIFRGKWMIFDFNKSFKADIQICQKGFGNARINNWFKTKEEKFKKIQMEDQEFNNMFRLYAQSEHDAFYVLTPSLMEKIKNLVSSIRGKVLFCLIDNKLHVGIQNNKDSFEPNIFTKIDEAKVVEEITRDIKLITNFVDELDLDNDLFRKGV